MYASFPLVVGDVYQLSSGGGKPANNSCISGSGSQCFKTFSPKM